MKTLLGLDKRNCMANMKQGYQINSWSKVCCHSILKTSVSRLLVILACNLTRIIITINLLTRKCPYTPISIDPRVNSPTKTPLTKAAGFEGWQTKGALSAGRDSLDGKYSITGVVGGMANRALDRLARQSKTKNIPFSLAIHFPGPHPPMFATGSTSLFHFATALPALIICLEISSPTTTFLYVHAIQNILINTGKSTTICLYHQALKMVWRIALTR